MTRTTLIAPSILSADFARLAEEVAAVQRGGADLLHVDVMDGHFVPNLTVGPPIVEALKKVTQLPLDVHLMITNADVFVDEFATAGADYLTVHVEACPHLHRNIEQIKSLGMQAGVAINPHTPVQFLQDVLADIDQVCMMSVNPGFGGQKFIPHTLEKIRQLRAMIDENGLKVKIEIDGGVTLDNAQSILDAGADILVAGNTVFKSADPIQTIKQLKSLRPSA